VIEKLFKFCFPVLSATKGGGIIAEDHACFSFWDYKMFVKHHFCRLFVTLTFDAPLVISVRKKQTSEDLKNIIAANRNDILPVS